MAEYIISDSAYDHIRQFHFVPVKGELIRCRDCKHFKIDECRCRYFLSPYPSTVDGAIVKGAITMSYVDPNGFCAWAERDE